MRMNDDENREEVRVTRGSACGSWPSPIGSADLVRGALRLAAPLIEQGRLYWLEGRPDEGGRQVVVSADLPAPESAASPALSAVIEVSPKEVNVRSRVHEYGGGEFTVWRDRLFFVSDADGRIFSKAVNESSRVVPVVPAGSLYANPVVSDDGRWLFAVEERPREGIEPENRIVAIELDDAGAPAAAPRIVASGHDFYASLVLSPDGSRLAFLAWDHPNMPWNGTLLETIEWGPAGARGNVVRRGGGERESLFQPRFAADGSLFVVTDRSGWWNLARSGESGLVAVHADAFEIGRPQWVFGMSAWSFVGSAAAGAGEVLAAATIAGVDQLVAIDLEKGSSRPRPSALRSIAGLTTGAGWTACVGGESAQGAALYLWRADRGEAPVRVRESSPFILDDDVVSEGVARSFDGESGRETHAFVYQPKCAGNTSLAGERPPLLVKSHGGPTSAASGALDPRIQFWTSRGFAVADVNYGGSTGYGRSYRDQLEENWGVVDVEDCVAVARALADDHEVDGERLAITGGSAGGYTTLCALTFHSVFAAGASHYGIGDLETLARDTHKFESRYTDWLVGPLPETRARYVERSPVHHADRLDCPVIFFQGLEDKVVPPNQAEAMVEILKARKLSHAYVPFPGEQHGFRRAENIRTALDGELFFYSRVFGFDAPQPPDVRVVEGVVDGVVDGFVDGDR